MIAFYMDGRGLGDQDHWGGIHLIQADGGSKPVTLSMHPSYDSKPSWSPDGSRIAFESNREDPDDQEHFYIYTMNSDGSHLTRVTDTDTFYVDPDWSPDGDRIALVSDKEEPGNFDIYVLDLKTRELTRLTDSPAQEAEPSWSPDGTHIVYTSDRDGSFNLYTMNMQTGETTRLTQESSLVGSLNLQTGETTQFALESGDNGQPDWSPDGEKILFISNRDGDLEIYVMDADGKNPSRLTTAPGKDMHPEWSPDGDSFAYAHQEGDGRSIYVADLEGSSPELLIKNTGGYPAWTIAQETISEDPVIGPPFCMRDTDGDFYPDTVSSTFTTEDDMAWVAFPYANMQDGMTFIHSWETPGDITFIGDIFSFWDGGEEGIHVSYNSLQHAPGVVKIKLTLDEELMQEIECEVVEP